MPSDREKLPEEVIDALREMRSQALSAGHSLGPHIKESLFDECVTAILAAIASAKATAERERDDLRRTIESALSCFRACDDALADSSVMVAAVSEAARTGEPMNLPAVLAQWSTRGESVGKESKLFQARLRALVDLGVMRFDGREYVFVEKPSDHA